MKRLVPLLVLVSFLVVPTGAHSATPSYSFRGMYGPGPYADIVNAGFSILDAGPFVSTLDSVNALGAKAWIWLGGYSNSTCSFNNTDSWVTTHLQAIQGHPAIAAYFIDDEPDASLCPNAPTQMKQRSDLVKTIDATHPTFISTYKTDQFSLFAGKVDVLALDHYPCSYAHGCQFNFITDEAAVADGLGVTYWIVIQTHGDDYYKLPTPAQLHTEMVTARATHMSGYIGFAWEWPRTPTTVALWLANHPELIAQWQIENAS
jgi:hypothetical protein